MFLEIQKMKQMQKHKYQQIIEASIKHFDKDKKSQQVILDDSDLSDDDSG